VAINYDRVLEDRVLVEAGRRGDRRFRASAPEAFMFTLRYLWRRLRGNGHRFGAAAVVTAEPLSLRAMAASGPPPAAEELADALFDRIRAAVPVPLLPLVAHVLREEPALRSEDEVVPAVAELVRQVEGRGLFLAFDPERLDDAVRFELMVLRRRKILAAGTGLELQGDGAELLDFYASSVAHHLAAGAKAAATKPLPAEFEPT
jgi:glycerol-3-phosphate O-acyltransferase